MKQLFIVTVKIYQKIISPFLPRSCKYYPTCSDYSIQAFKKYGVFRGLLKSIYRILRCNPFSKGGYDPLK